MDLKNMDFYLTSKFVDLKSQILTIKISNENDKDKITHNMEKKSELLTEESENKLITVIRNIFI